MRHRKHKNWLYALTCFSRSALAASVWWVLPVDLASAQPVPAAPPPASTVSPQSAPTVPPQTTAATSDWHLKHFFDAAWKRQPEALSLAARMEAADSARQAAQSWTAEPAALELSSKTDRLNRNLGAREYEAGIGIPLWLPGERAGAGALADTEARGIDARIAVAKLKVAAAVREAYWAWERARVEHGLARDRLNTSRALAADVAKRVSAGYLSRADQHQVDGAVAAAESALAESTSALVAAAQQLRALSGQAPPSHTTPASAGTSAPGQTVHAGEGAPVPAANLLQWNASHPAVADLTAQFDVARLSEALARVRSRANPELRLSTTHHRGEFGDPYQQTLNVGVRIPFGSDARHRARVASASAQAIEIEGQLQLERGRVLAELEAATQRVDSARAQADAAGKRARLARETRGFFEKSFRLGETDLPTRLRIELEAVEAERQEARSRIDQAASLSALRQALGLLPE